MATANTNLTSTHTLSATMQTFYDRLLLKNMEPNLVWYNLGQKRPLPRNQGKTINFRKWTPFEAITDPLTEGVVPDGQALTMTEVTATIDQYGGYVSVSDLLDMTALDPVISDSVTLMANQGALSIDTMTRDKLAKGTIVQYANGKGSRGELLATDVLTTVELRKAVRTLKKARAPKFDGYYVAVVSHDAVYDLQSDKLWEDTSKYQDKTAVMTGEIGRIVGCRIVECDNPIIFAGAGSGSVDVHGALVLGKDAFGRVDLGGADNKNARVIVKPRGSAGTADPLDQFSTVGWKVDGYVAAILQQGWMVRIEHGVTE